MNLAKQHRQHFEDRPLKPETLAEYRQLAEASLAEQRELEAQEEGSFEDYMRRYYRQYEGCQEDPSGRAGSVAEGDSGSPLGGLGSG